MRRIDVSQLEAQLADFLRLVKRGETIEVLDGTVPIARIGPPSTSSRREDAPEALLSRLVDQGVVTRAMRAPDPDALSRFPRIGKPDETGMRACR